MKYDAAFRLHVHEYVTLCVRVWIEISWNDYYGYPKVVTLCVRVWIEIWTATSPAAAARCHPLREGVD